MLVIHCFYLTAAILALLRELTGIKSKAGSKKINVIKSKIKLLQIGSI